MTDAARQFRCAVYTRKSTEEGLDQAFNSLHAQREACEAFISSQRGEGWKFIKTAYDDGGISGGTMERPALKRLMADIQSELIDVVVVYKVDRLTRSLHDFSKMVDIFDRHKVSFVAVTQQFNTTTSMGRLTLNVLLSFAQFEREVAGERIRDKIAASKRKGIWMGGGLPRGYKVVDRKLVIVPKEAAIVRTVYRRYLESNGGIRALALTLRKDGITSINAKGVADTISRGALYSLLRNPVYAGLLPHKGEHFPGQHKAIVDRRSWDAAQEKLKVGAPFSGRPERKTDASPLKGKVFDESGRRLSPTHTIKRGRRYRYYVSHTDDVDDGRFEGVERGWRLPAVELEKRVGLLVGAMVKDRASIARVASAAQMTTTDTAALLLRTEEMARTSPLDLVQQVSLRPDEIGVKIALPNKPPLHLEASSPMSLRRRGIEQRLVIRPTNEKPGKPDPNILKALGVGLRYWAQLNSSSGTTARECAKAESVDAAYLCRALRLAFLAPDLIERFTRGQQPIDWTAKTALRWTDLPVSWREQRRLVEVSA
jgi:site-specific DNA recombinase